MKLFGACMACGEGPLDSSKGDYMSSRIHKECQLLLSAVIKKQRLDSYRPEAMEVKQKQPETFGRFIPGTSREERIKEIINCYLPDRDLSRLQVEDARMFLIHLLSNMVKEN